MKSVLTLLLWSGIALGQTPCFVRDSKGHETKEPCHKTVCWEGCEKTNGSWPVPAFNDAHTEFLIVDDMCHKPTACRPEELGDEVVTYTGIVRDSGSGKQGFGRTAEPLDVPAISVKKELRPDSEDGGYLLGFSRACKHYPGGTMSWKPEVIACHYEFHMCLDSTRILEHDEQTPPKYWCRKVQP